MPGSSGVHMKMRKLSAIAALLALSAPAPGAAPAAGPTAAATAEVRTAEPREFVTRHSGIFGGRKVRYTAIAGETILKDADGRPAASVFTFSYLEDGVKNPAARPVVFVFNGGPGSASLWLHMGMLGPRRVDFPDPVRPPTAAPFSLTDSPHSLLDVADLVFIDPVGTGYSKLLPGGRPEDFFGVTQDARATAEIMRHWLTRHRRWSSPKFVLGESYGTVRAIKLAHALMGGVRPPHGRLGGISLNGIIVLGPAFGSGAGGGDIGYLTALPSMAASAWYHGKADNRTRTLDAALEEARALARDDYVRALFAGSTLSEAERERVASSLARITGLAPATWLEHDLRIGPGRFAELLLKDDGLRIGLYDSRYTLQRQAGGGDPVVDDPAMGQYTPGFVAALNQYLVTELKVDPPGEYVPIAWTDVNFRWDWGAGPGVHVPQDHTAELATAMVRNPSLHVFIGAGYFDLVTTLGAAEYAIAHAAIPRDRVSLRGYPSGHMPYLGEDSARQLAADLRTFIREASTR